MLFRSMAGIDAAFHGLHVIACLHALGHEYVAVGQVCPLHARSFRLLVFGTHVGPDYPRALHTGVAGDGHLFAHLGRLRDIHALAFNIELQAMIAAADAIIFVAPEIERCATMRADFREETRPSLGVAEGTPVFATHITPDRR